jgi:CheY-like chemotaxis protein/TolA-binding protein
VAKQHLLLVDGDAKSLRVMEVSLKKAGFQVTTAIHGKDALEKVQISPPDLVLSETRMPEMDGFELCKVLKSDERFRHIPFVFLTSQKAVESKVKGLETGADDYLTKPIYIKEVVTRVRMILQKVEKERIERKETRAGFSGSLADMGVVDLVQTFEIGRKTGAIKLEGERTGIIYFKEGRVIDAELGRLRGENAFYRMLNTFEGQFEVSFAPVDRPERIEVSTQGLLMEGMRRLDEWGRMLEQLPPLETVFELDYEALAERLAEIPDEVNGLLRLFDGRRSLARVVDDSDFEDLAALGIISKLYFEGLIREVGSPPSSTSERRKKPGIEEWLNTGPRPAGGEAPSSPSVTPAAPLPPAQTPVAEVPVEPAPLEPLAEPELPPLGEEEAVALEPEPGKAPVAPAIPPVLPAQPPPRETPKAQVVRFEPKARQRAGTPGSPAQDSQFLVESPPRELERARSLLLEKWASVDVEGLGSESTWAPVGWARAPEGPRPKPPEPAVALKPPVFGGAALERYSLPPLPKPEPLRPAAEEGEPLALSDGPPQPEGLPPPHSTPPSSTTSAKTPPPASQPLGPTAPSTSLPSPPALAAPVPAPSSSPSFPPTPTLGKVTPPRASPPSSLEESFFSDTEGTGSQPLSVENPVPRRSSKALPLVVVAGLLLGVLGTVWVMRRPPAVDEHDGHDAGLPLVVALRVDAGALAAAGDAGVEPAEQDALALTETPHNAGADTVARVDAGGPAVASGGARLRDAGAPPEVDVGALAFAARDGGAMAALAQDAGATVASAGVDAGAATPDVEATLADARAALVAHQYRRAVALFRTAQKERPDDPRIRAGLGIALVMSDQGYKEAVPYLKDAVKDDPENASAWMALGVALYNLGREREAKVPFQEFLKLKPNAPEARDVRETLKMIP